MSPYRASILTFHISNIAAMQGSDFASPWSKFSEDWAGVSSPSPEPMLWPEPSLTLLFLPRQSWCSPSPNFCFFLHYCSSLYLSPPDSFTCPDPTSLQRPRTMPCLLIVRIAACSAVLTKQHIVLAAWAAWDQGCHSVVTSPWMHSRFAR